MPFPFGPRIGSVSLASPESPERLIDPLAHQPASIGAPRCCTTAGLDLARATAPLATSEPFRRDTTKKSKPATAATISVAMRTTNPSSNFQFRASQPPGGGFGSAADCPGMIGFIWDIRPLKKKGACIEPPQPLNCNLPNQLLIDDSRIRHQIEADAVAPCGARV